MTKIIVELDTFKYEDMHILLGSDILSRELHFYIENNNEIIPVSDVVKNRILTKIAEPSQSLNEIKQFIYNVGKKYLENNNLYGFPNSVLQRNLQNLCVEYNECYLQESSASYEAFHNIMNIKLPRKYLNVSNVNMELSSILRQIIAHEIGHLSVSEIQLDDSGNVIISTGFLQAKIPISESLRTTDGNVYYRLDNSKKIQENEGRGLEELYNALETDKVTNNALSPNFAHKLNRITEGKLLSARRKHSLEEYYNVMQSIIPSYDRAQLLLIGLKCYYEAINGNDKELVNQLNSMIEQLIDDYEIHFLSSNSKKGVK